MSLGNWTEGPRLEKKLGASLDGAELSHFHILKLLCAGQYENLQGTQENFGIYSVPEEIILTTENASKFCSLESPRTVR